MGRFSDYAKKALSFMTHAILPTLIGKLVTGGLIVFILVSLRDLLIRAFSYALPISPVCLSVSIIALVVALTRASQARRAAKITWPRQYVWHEEFGVNWPIYTDLASLKDADPADFVGEPNCPVCGQTVSVLFPDPQSFFKAIDFFCDQCCQTRGQMPRHLKTLERAKAEVWARSSRKYDHSRSR